MMHHVSVLLLIVLIIAALVSTLPRWPYSRDWGYAPFMGVQVVIMIGFLLWLIDKL